MCGLIGFLSKKHLVNEPALRKMGDSIFHRGPDHQGIFIDKKHNVGLLNQRLAIMDLRPNANQPFFSKDGRFVLVFNGEIYNFKEIRHNLEIKGIQFSTNCDSEVLVEIYAHEGNKCLEKLNGMFAFAILDRETGEILIARDRLGIKPLYYYHSNDFFAFTSDLKAFQPNPLIPKTIRQQSLIDYLCYDVIPQPYSIYENIFKLLPGHFLTVNRDNELTIKQYWDIDLEAKVLPESPDLPEQFLELFSKSVKRRIQSDAKVGVFLSGGMDSSAVISQMGNQYPTFTIGFKHASNNLDIERSKLVATHFDLKHHLEIIDIENLEHFINFIDVIDEPISIQSMVPLVANYAIAKHAGVKVILSGDGADEILGGYSDFPQLLKLHQLKQFQKNLLKPFLTSGNKILSPYKAISKPGKFRDLYLKPWQHLIDFSHAFQRHQFMSSTRAIDSLKILFGNNFQFPNDPMMEEIYGKISTLNWNLLLAAQTKSPLVNRNFAKIDKTSMANSIEARVPFMDHELVEFVFRLPEHWRMDKKILKESMKQILPAQIINDRKRGFNLPFQKWLEQSILPNIDKYFNYQLLYNTGVFRTGSIENLIKTAHDTSKNHNKIIWNLMVLSKWLEVNEHQCMSPKK